MNIVQDVAPAVLWASLLVVFYVYAGYPVLIWVLARTLGHLRDPGPAEDADLPFLSVLIAAYNEEAVIGERVENALALDYPRDRLEVVVASDGSSDRTPEIVRRFADRGVRLFDYGERRGKSAVLNATVPELRGSIVLLSDANALTDAQAGRNLARWFADPHVGVVCGRLVLRDRASGRNVDGLYWKYETFLKKCESLLGALLGSNGAIYAMRRGLFEPIPSDTIVDDFVIPLTAKLRTGCYIIYDRDAVACEETAADIRAEFGRRARIGAGGFQSIGHLWGLLDPRRGWVALTFLSHKVLRWAGPFFLIAAFGANLVLATDPGYGPLLLGQLGFYAGSLSANWLPARPRVCKWLRLGTMFTVMNLALLVGFVRWVSGTQRAAWKRTARVAEVAEVG